MGHAVTLLVSFNCTNNDAVAPIARRHLSDLHDVEDCPEALWFLTDLSSRKGENPGHKGGLSTWSNVGNYTLEDRFVEALRPFWKDLLESDAEFGPAPWDHILVLVQHEQTSNAVAFEVFFEVADELTIKRHECPFGWSGE